MLLVGMIVVLLLLLWWCRRKEREGLMSPSCSLLADEQSNSMAPVPFCANGNITRSATKCQAMRSGKCKKPYNHPVCVGALEFNDGQCV